MPTPKKFWVQDGHIEQYPDAYAKEGKGHFGLQCTVCHGGDDTRSTREEAHAGFVSQPTQDKCSACHPNAGSHVQGSQHTSLTGFDAVMAARGLDGSVGAQRFDKQCTKCHVATATDQATCGQCHISVPSTAGGGFLKGHVFQRTPSTDNNCTACHGSRVKDEYYGLNNELLARNAATFSADSPWTAYELQPDVHRAAGKGCEFCHSGDEMHGVGTVAGDDRYTVSTAPSCTDCHTPSPSILMHTAKHLETMSCHVCHAQPYKNCFGCHTDEKSGVGYYTINEGDPTRAARTPVPADWSATTAYAKDVFVTFNAATYRSLQAANTGHTPNEPASTWWVAATPKLVAGDALMAFRVGLNPRSGDPRHPEKYVVLRHAPVDRDVFRYSGLNEGAGVVEDLFSSITAVPTWKFSTPHTIARKTPMNSTCFNCHGAEASKFWLTDPVADALGWVANPADPAKTAAYQADEQAANAPALAPVPIPLTATAQ